MKMRVQAVLAALMLSAAPTALANDGFGGLTATGLEFSNTKDVQMQSEDLYLSLDRIKVSYLFHSTASSDISGEIIFPLPPIGLMETHESEFAIPEDQRDKENLVDFTASVDGTPVKVTTDRIAVLETPSDDTPKLSAGYEQPGKDITAILQKYNIPISLNFNKVSAALKALPQAAKDDLKAQGLAEFDDGGNGDGPYPGWAIVERYHWSQTFPAGKDVRIEHSYKSTPPGGIFMMHDPKTPDEQYDRDLIKKYCIDPGTQSAMRQALQKSDDGSYYSGIGYYLDYVLMTANTWAGPIGDFKLTVDKGSAKNVLSLCDQDIKKVGPTTFSVERKNFTPTHDLSILIVAGPGGAQ